MDGSAAMKSSNIRRHPSRDPEEKRDPIARVAIVLMISRHSQLVKPREYLGDTANQEQAP